MYIRAYICRKLQSGDILIVVLDIKKLNTSGIKGRLTSLFRKSHTESEICSGNDISVLSIKHRYYHGKPNFNRIYPYIKDVTDTVLCGENLIPENYPIERFCDNTLNIRLMENFILDILGSFPMDSFKVCVHDPLAECHEFIERLFSFVSEITVCTEMTCFYGKRAATYYQNTGGTLKIVNTPDDLPPCDILIYKNKINTVLPQTEATFIFTAYKPDTKIHSKIIYKYIPRFPDEYREILPESTDRNYFLCALYSMCGKNELDKLIPEICISTEGVLSKGYLMHIMMNTDSTTNK